MNLRDQLAEVQAKLEQEKALGQRKDSEKISSLEQEEANLLEQIMHCDQSQEEREQRHAENVGGLIDKLIDSGLYEKIYGERPEGERIYEYDENRKNFYMIVNAMMEEEKEADRQYYENQLAARDEKIRRLTEQGIKAESQLSAEREKVSEMDGMIIGLQAEVAESEVLLQKANTERDAAVEQLELEKSKHSITVTNFNELGRICDQKNAKIDELESKLEQVQRPKASATTNSTKDLIANLKPAGNLQERVNKALERWNLEPITAPEIPSVNGGDSFRPEVTAPELTSDQLHTPEAPETVTGEQFRSGDSNNPEAPMVGDNTGTEAGIQDQETVSDTVTRAEFEALKKRVESIENKNVGVAA